MTIPAPWTAVRATPNSSPRNPVARRGVQIHHQAGTNFENQRRKVTGVNNRSVSYTAICWNRHLELIVPDDSRRPWSSGTAHWDSAMRTICLTNSTLGPGWHVSDDTLNSAAAAVAYWASREGWWPHRAGTPSAWTVIGHRELRTIHGASFATACPGGVSLDLITARAQQILARDPQEETMPNVITVSVPVDAAGNQAWWSMNLADNTISRIHNGVQLDFRRNIGIPEFVNQAPAILAGYRELGATAAAFTAAPVEDVDGRDPDVDDADDFPRSGDEGDTP